MLKKSPWNISFLNCSQNEQNDLNKFINSQKMGVLLMCTIQEICNIAEISFDLYLQTCYENASFMWGSLPLGSVMHHCIKDQLLIDLV